MYLAEDLLAPGFETAMAWGYRCGSPDEGMRTAFRGDVK